MDTRSLRDVGAVIDAVDHYLEYGHMPISDKLCIARLIKGLEKIRDDLIRIVAEANPIVESRPWCCHVDCREAATWEIVHGSSPSDNTQACDRHLAELCCDHNEVQRIS